MSDPVDLNVFEKVGVKRQRYELEIDPSNSSLSFFDFSLKGGAKSRKTSKSTLPGGKKQGSKSNENNRKSKESEETKKTGSKFLNTTSPKMKKKKSFTGENTADLTQYTSPKKTNDSNTSTPRKSPASRKVKFVLDQNTVMEFNKKHKITKKKISSSRTTSKGILKVRTSPRKN